MGPEAEPLVIAEELPLVDTILDEWRLQLGGDFTAYRNHVYRVVNFSLALETIDDDQRTKVMLAGVFHDLGIWSAGTFDYLAPSVQLAIDYLHREGLEAWTADLAPMIAQHHKLTRHPDPLVDAFRRADLVDVSLGCLRGGLPGRYVADVRRRFPNAGFHKRLVQLELAWLPRHPLRPLPVLKW